MAQNKSKTLKSFADLLGEEITEVTVSTPQTAQQGLVYSTEGPLAPSAKPSVETLSPKEQDLRITLNKRLKGGKQATVIYQFKGAEADLANLGDALKKHCGVGGSVKDGEIILQGDCLQKAAKYLDKKGYRFKFAGI